MDNYVRYTATILNEQTSNKMIHAILAPVFLTSYFNLPVLCSKAIKLICDRKKSDQITPHYFKLNILKFQDVLYMKTR